MKLRYTAAASAANTLRLARTRRNETQQRSTTSSANTAAASPSAFAPRPTSPASTLHAAVSFKVFTYTAECNSVAATCSPSPAPWPDIRRHAEDGKSRKPTTSRVTPMVRDIC